MTSAIPSPRPGSRPPDSGPVAATEAEASLLMKKRSVGGGCDAAKGSPDAPEVSPDAPEVSPDAPEVSTGESEGA
jgi:hypothetical protein